MLYIMESYMLREREATVTVLYQQDSYVSMLNSSENEGNDRAALLPTLSETAKGVYCMLRQGVRHGHKEASGASPPHGTGMADSSWNSPVKTGVNGQYCYVRPHACRT